MATIAFVNGAVFDGRRHLGAASVLVEGGRVVAVGEVDLPAAARIVDADGGLVAPGFVDAHVHAVQGGLERTRCDLSGGRTREDYLRLVRAHADARPDAAWILGGGWAMAAFPGGTPTAADLDAVVPERPVFLPNRDHHGAWVNTRALELAGITSDTPNRRTGASSGTPTAARPAPSTKGRCSWWRGCSPRPRPPSTTRGCSRGRPTSTPSASPGGRTRSWGPTPAWTTSARRTSGPRSAETLSAHVVGALWWDRDRGEEQVASLVERRGSLSHGRFRATSVKVMQDGVAENGTAALSAPYLDRCGHATANTGHSFVDPTALRRLVARLDAEGFQVHVHAIGDRGVREALEAFEAVAGSDRRHQVAHLQLVRPDDVRRFGALGVAANIQALWACLDDQMVDLTLPFIGEERAGWQYPFGALHRSGARLVAGSDWPVSTPNPLEAIHVAVNRWAYGADGREGSEPFLPEQAIDLETAFAAYTSGSAWVNHRDDAGLLAPGHVADLVVLDRDPFVGAPAEVGATRVVSTWVDGVAVHGG